MRWPGNEGRGSAPAILLLLGVLLTAFNIVNVLLLRLALDQLVYLTDAAVLLMAAASFATLQRMPLSPGVRPRVLLWAACLGCYGVARVWAPVRDRYFNHGLSHVQIGLYAATYTLAFLAIVNPPSGWRWNQRWILDGLQATVLAVMFSQVALFRDRGMEHLMFTAVLQAFLAIAAFLGSGSSTNVQERRITACMGAYFVCTAVLSLLTNLVEAWGMTRAAVLSDSLYPVDSLLALSLSCAVRFGDAEPVQRSPGGSSIMPFLTTVAILLLCLPILEARPVRGMLLMGSALLLFGVRTSLLLSGQQAEHSRLRKGHEELRKLAGTDPLTGIANRRAFMDAMAAAVMNAAAEGVPFALVLMDLDNLKQINDSRGHKAGDIAIRTFATTLQDLAGTPFGHTARLGGDEFAAMLPAGIDATAWTASLRERLVCSGLGFSAGTALCGTDGHTPPAVLIERADDLLYQEKQSRKHIATPRVWVTGP